MWLYIRLVLFEKYNFYITVLWWVIAFVVAFVVRGLYAGLGVVVILIAVVLQKRFVKWMQQHKARLIRKGDRVEFAQDEAEGYIQKFESGKVLEKMRGEDVLLSGLFSEELVPLYSHFYLIEMEQKNTIIPYEWILSIDVAEIQGFDAE